LLRCFREHFRGGGNSVVGDPAEVHRLGRQRGVTAGRFIQNSTKTSPHQELTQHSTKAIMSEDQIADVPPDQLSTDPDSPFFSEEVLRRDVGIRFNGVEKTNVQEYNVTEGWVRVAVPTAKDRRGNPMVVKLNGTVEPYFRLAE